MALLERDWELAATDAVLTRGGALVVEGGAGIGKSALLDVAAGWAQDRGYTTLRARGSKLEAEFAFGVVRQLFERPLMAAEAAEREELLAGPAGAARTLLLLSDSGGGSASVSDTAFAVVHGLYWLAVNLAGLRPLGLIVDDAHWADQASLRWLAYLIDRLDGLRVALLVALRPAEPPSSLAPLLAVRAQATVCRPRVLTRPAVAALVRDTRGADTGDEVCVALWRASGGNPFYLSELLRAMPAGHSGDDSVGPDRPATGPGEVVARHVLERIHRLERSGLTLAQALAVLGDGCELRHAAAVAEITPEQALRLGVDLVSFEVLAGLDPPRFLHPIVREVVEASMTVAEFDTAHRAAARLLHREGARAGRVAVHLAGLRPAGDPWTAVRLREAGREAMEEGAPRSAAELLQRALSEPPPSSERIGVLRELARAEIGAGRETACARLAEARVLTSDPRLRAEIALEAAEAYAGLFRWVDAVDVADAALAELGDADPLLADQLQAELVISALHDARRAARVEPVLARLRQRHPTGSVAEAVAVAKGMAMILAGRPVTEAAAPLEQALAGSPVEVENWDTRAALLWSLVTAECFAAVEAALEPMQAQIHRSGSARGFVATYSTLGLLKLRLGALPEADAAARVALRVLQESDFTPGLAFGATVLADVAIEAGELDEAAALIGLLPQGGWPAGVGTVLIPAARARLRLAQGRPSEALEDFARCAGMFRAELWGVELRDVGYLHARSGAATALLLLGRRDEAVEQAEAELADIRRFGAPRALGVATRIAGLVIGGKRGLDLLADSVAALRQSPALLEQTKSLTELGAAQRRAGERAAARQPLSEALDLAARCGARPLTARIREELHAAGARPRRDWRRGVEALTPSELRVVRLAADGRTNREIAHTLYVSLKTVEGHLARAYGKLGISGRVELPDALHGEKSRVVTRS